MFDLRDVCTLAALVLAAVGVAYGSHQRAWARVLELHVNALWSEREARYAQRPLVAPEAQAVALAPDRIDRLEAIAAERPEPPPLADARTLVRTGERIVPSDRRTRGFSLDRYLTDEEREA